MLLVLKKARTNMQLDDWKNSELIDMLTSCMPVVKADVAPYPDTII